MLTLKSPFTECHWNKESFPTSLGINCDDLSKWNVMNVGSRDIDFVRNSGSKDTNLSLNGVTRTRIPESNRVGASIAGPWDYVSDLVELGWKRSDFESKRKYEP